MFAWWGRTVYRYRYIVIGVMVALSLGSGIFGLSLGKHVTQSGFYDDGSQSVKASVLGDKVYGRDRTGYIIAIFKAPDGKTINDAAWAKRITDELNKFKTDHPDQVVGWAGYLAAPETTSAVVQGMVTQERKHTFVSIPLKGDDDDTILNNYKAIAPDLQKLDGGKVQLAGLEPVANALDRHHRLPTSNAWKILALPLVAIVLFFVFGGVIAAGAAGDSRWAVVSRARWVSCGSSRSSGPCTTSPSPSYPWSVWVSQSTTACLSSAGSAKRSPRATTPKRQCGER